MINEKQVENQILTYLTMMGVWCWKVQRAGIYDVTRGRYRATNNHYHINGIPDINGILKDGRPIYIEVKKPYISRKSKQVMHRTQEQLEKLGSPEQRSFIVKAKERGAVAFFADSIAIVEEQLVLFGARRATAEPLN